MGVDIISFHSRKGILLSIQIQVTGLNSLSTSSWNSQGTQTNGLNKTSSYKNLRLHAYKS